MAIASPTRLSDSGNVAPKAEQPEADTAQAELAQKTPRAAATKASIAGAALKLRRLRELLLVQPFIPGDFCGCCH